MITRRNFFIWCLGSVLAARLAPKLAIDKLIGFNPSLAQIKFMKHLSLYDGAWLYGGRAGGGKTWTMHNELKRMIEALEKDKMK